MRFEKNYIQNAAKFCLMIGDHLKAIVEILQIDKKYSNSFFNAIMEADEDTFCLDGRGGFQKVNRVLLQTEELHQSVKQFLELCLTSNSSYAGKQELISEIVAVNDISRARAELKLKAFCRKADKLKSTGEKVEEARKKLLSVNYHTDVAYSSDNEEHLEKICNLIVYFSAWIKLNSKFYKEMRHFLKEFWIYISPEARDLIEKQAFFFAESRPKRKCAEVAVIASLKALKVFIDSKPRSCYSKKIAFLNIPSLFASYDNEVIQLVDLVFQYADQGRSKKDWYDSDIMEKFLDSLVGEIKDDNSKLVPYTKEMDNELELLLDGVEVD